MSLYTSEVSLRWFAQILRRFLSTVKITTYRTKTGLKATIKTSKEILSSLHFHILKTSPAGEKKYS